MPNASWFDCGLHAALVSCREAGVQTVAPTPRVANAGRIYFVDAMCARMREASSFKIGLVP
jgi:hypothetical protein